jgi:hypothetical protein
MSESTYNVTFIGDYFSMNVTVAGVEGDEEVAIDLANNIMKSHYGWDLLSVSTIEVEAIKEEYV